MVFPTMVATWQSDQSRSVPGDVQRPFRVAVFESSRHKMKGETNLQESVRKGRRLKPAPTTSRTASKQRSWPRLLNQIPKRLFEAAEYAGFGHADGGGTDSHFLGDVGRRATFHDRHPEGAPGALLKFTAYQLQRSPA